MIAFLFLAFIAGVCANNAVEVEIPAPGAAPRFGVSKKTSPYGGLESTEDFVFKQYAQWHSSTIAGDCTQARFLLWANTAVGLLSAAAW